MTSFSKWFSYHANHLPYFFFQEILTPLDLLKLSLSFFVCFSFDVVVVVVYFSFNAQNVEIVIEKQIHMHLNFIDPKIKIFRGFWLFVLSPIPKNEILEITEILQKRHDTEIWEYNFKKCWNDIKIIQPYY